MLRSYLRLTLFALGLLIGLQLPGFMQSYSQRVDAHRLEAEASLQGFRDTAGEFFSGDLIALVAHYRESNDPIFRKDAYSVQSLINRSALLEQESKAMSGAWYQQLWHLITRADPELIKETRTHYRYQVLLEPSVIVWGLCSALLLAWLVEGLFGLLVALFKPQRRRIAHLR